MFAECTLCLFASDYSGAFDNFMKNNTLTVYFPKAHKENTEAHFLREIREIYIYYF